MLVPDAPGATDLPNGLSRLAQSASPFASPGTGFDAASFQSLDVAAKMAFLNIEAKLRETVIDGAPLMSFVRGVRHAAVDRVFVLFDPGLKARMPRAAEFGGAPGHRAPAAFPDLPDHPDSWKHRRFAEGNIQLCFSEDAAPWHGAGGTPSLVHSADVDIDLGKGLAHAHEWLVNNVFRPGHKTNQALVYAMLFAQNILPRYTLDPAPATTRSAAARLRSMQPAPEPASPKRALRKRPLRKRPLRKRAVAKRAVAKRAAPKRRQTRRGRTARR